MLVLSLSQLQQAGIPHLAVVDPRCLGETHEQEEGARKSHRECRTLRWNSTVMVRTGEIFADRGQKAGYNSKVLKDMDNCRIPATPTDSAMQMPLAHL